MSIEVNDGDGSVDLVKRAQNGKNLCVHEEGMYVGYHNCTQ